MSALYCDKCGEPWSNHENCDDDPDVQSRNLRHIEQLKSEMIEDRKEIEMWRKKFLLFGGTPQEAASAVAKRMLAMDDQITSLKMQSESFQREYSLCKNGVLVMEKKLIKALGK